MSNSTHNPTEPPPMAWRHFGIAGVVCGLQILGFFGFLWVSGVLWASGVLSSEVFPNSDGSGGLGVLFVVFSFSAAVDRPESQRRRMIWLLVAIPVAVFATAAGALAVAALSGWHEGEPIGSLVRQTASMGAAGFTMILLTILIYFGLLGPSEWRQEAQRDADTE